MDTRAPPSFGGILTASSKLGLMASPQLNGSTPRRPWKLLIWKLHIWKLLIWKLLIWKLLIWKLLFRKPLISNAMLTNPTPAPTGRLARLHAEFS